MSNYVFEENTRVYFSATLTSTDLSEVTLAEITGATDLTDNITKDGFQPGVSNNRVSVAHLGTSFDGEVMGSWGSQLSITGLRDDEADTVWDTLGVRGTEGYIIMVPLGSGTAGAPADADTAMIWEIETGTPVIPQTTANERQTATIECAVANANMNAAVAAS